MNLYSSFLSVYLLVIVLCATDEQVRTIMLLAYDLGMTSEEYLYLTLPYWDRTFTDMSPYRNNDDNDEKAFAAYQRLFYVC